MKNARSTEVKPSALGALMNIAIVIINKPIVQQVMPALAMLLGYITGVMA